VQKDCEKEEFRGVLVSIATYNEIGTVGEIIVRVMTLGSGFNVLVIDDSSPDGTANYVKRRFVGSERVSVIVRTGTRGLGSAIQEGMVWCVDHGYTSLVNLDGDLSHDPAEIPKLLLPLNEMRSRFVIGSRYLASDTVLRGWPCYRQMLSRCAGRAFRSATGLSLTDPTSGFRAYHVETLKKMNCSQPSDHGYGFHMEFAANAAKKGIAISEVPISFQQRAAGRSKLTLVEVFRVTTRLLRLLRRR
jgi:dolichol-phosphate mannosyltransferase